MHSCHQTLMLPTEYSHTEMMKPFRRNYRRSYQLSIPFATSVSASSKMTSSFVRLLTLLCVTTLVVTWPVAAEPEQLPENTSACIPTNMPSLCRFNVDCCSGLCATYKIPSPVCVENTPNNHVFDAFAALPVVKPCAECDERIKYPGMARWRRKVAVVTGAASGIGFALAKRLCREHMIVVGVDMDKLGVEKVAEFCPKDGYFPYAANLRREQDILKLFEFINTTLGRVDVLVNNAGIARATSLIDASSEALRSMFSVNVLAPVLCTREALKIMIERNITNGYIMFTNSDQGYSVRVDQPDQKNLVQLHLYEATKHALRVIREGLRTELRAKGLKIRVGDVAPGNVLTNIAESLIPRDVADEAKVKQTFEGIAALGREGFLMADDVAEAFVYMLQSPERMDVNTVSIQPVP